MTDSKKKGSGAGAGLIITRLVLITAILGAAGYGATWLSNNEPKAKRKPKVSITPVVNVIPMQSKQHSCVVRAMGTVIPANEVALRARIRAEVKAVNPDFLAGGIVKAGESLLELDEADYSLALREKEADLARAESNLQLELGRQDVARHEWKMLGDEKASDFEKQLALRVPQLKASRADLERVKVAVAKAKLDLSRTKITAPFNSVLLSADVRAGDQVDTQTVIARMAGVDRFHIQVSVPVHKVDWVEIPDKRGQGGAAVTVIAGEEREFKGRVIKLLGDIESKGRMARLLVEVEDPFNLRGDGGKRLLLGEFVSVNITGPTLENVCEIPRSAYRNNKEIWLISKDNRLRMMPVNPVWEERGSVFVRAEGLPGDRLISTDLTFPVADMVIRVEGEGEPQELAGKGKKGRGGKGGKSGSGGGRQGK